MTLVSCQLPLLGAQTQPVADVTLPVAGLTSMCRVRGTLLQTTAPVDGLSTATWTRITAGVVGRGAGP
jgi:hypothetical protein